MDMFNVLSAPIRREIIELLSKGKLTATAISEQFQVSPSAISQHLKLLTDSKILQVHKNAQQRIYELNTESLNELEQWTKWLREQADLVANPASENKPKNG